MLYPVIISLAGIFASPSNDLLLQASKPAVVKETNFQDPPSAARLRVVDFKAQDYCRAELKDFEFDAHFVIISADVYFTGANFINMQRGAITSSSLKSIRSLMDKCTVGTTVTFDNIKVKGPDNAVRVIDGVSYLLY